jgi:hypothetical protein
MTKQKVEKKQKKTETAKRLSVAKPHHTQPPFPWLNQLQSSTTTKQNPLD